MKQLRPEPERFFDGGVDGDPGRPEVPPDRAAPPQIELRGIAEEGLEQFAMERRIGYDDRELGVLLVPRETGSFRTDLTSVPALFTWLVPRTGKYLPAALLHDGLIFEPGTPASYTSAEGHEILRPAANRVLRDAMADTGTGVVRRWLVWSAVTAATILRGRSTGWSRTLRWRLRGAAVLSIAVVVVLGTLATLDLFDVDGTPQLPWMGDRPLWEELVGGLAAAVLIPLVLGLLWGRFWAAGCILGVGLAVLLHVTVVLLLLTGLYQVTEWLAGKWPAAGAGHLRL